MASSGYRPPTSHHHHHSQSPAQSSIQQQQQAANTPAGQQQPQADFPYSNPPPAAYYPSYVQSQMHPNSTLPTTAGSSSAVASQIQGQALAQRERERERENQQRERERERERELREKELRELREREKERELAAQRVPPRVPLAERDLYMLSLPSQDLPTNYSPPSSPTSSTFFPDPPSNRGNKLLPNAAFIRRGRLGAYPTVDAGFKPSASPNELLLSGLLPHEEGFAVAPNLHLLQPYGDASAYSSGGSTLAVLPPPPSTPMDLLRSSEIQRTLGNKNKVFRTLGMSATGLIEQEGPLIGSLGRVCAGLRGEGFEWRWVGDEHSSAPPPPPPPAALVAPPLPALPTSTPQDVAEGDKNDKEKVKDEVSDEMDVDTAPATDTSTPIITKNGDVEKEKEKTVPAVDENVVTAPPAVVDVEVSDAKMADTEAPAKETAPGTTETNGAAPPVEGKSEHSEKPKQEDVAMDVEETAPLPPLPTLAGEKDKEKVASTEGEASAKIVVAGEGGDISDAKMAEDGTGGEYGSGGEGSGGAAGDEEGEGEEEEEEEAQQEAASRRRRSGRVASRTLPHSRRNRSGSQTSTSSGGDSNLPLSGRASGLSGGRRRNGDDGDEDEEEEELPAYATRLVDPEVYVRSLFVSRETVEFEVQMPGPGNPVGVDRLSPNEQEVLVHDCLTDLHRFLADSIEYRARLAEIRDGVLGIERRRKGMWRVVRSLVAAEGGVEEEE